MQGGRIFLLAAAALLLVLMVWRKNSIVAVTSEAWSADSSALARRPLPLQPSSDGSSSFTTTPASMAAAARSPTAVQTVESALRLQPTGKEKPEPPGPERSLPGCSVVFFHHLEKTAGTTVRSVLQRHAQLGEFDFISFVNRFDKLQLQMVLHRLHTLLDQPGGLDNLRLAVEIHIGGHLNHPYFNLYTLPDLLLLRSLLRARGCKCNLVTMLRHPLLHHLSWHYHFCNHRVPLCFWRNPPDCQTRLALGLTCHDGPHLKQLTPAHEKAVRFLYDSFDLVGVTELFDEFVLQLSDLVGMQRPAYRSQIVASHTLSRQLAQRNWTARTCSQLLADPPPDLMGLIEARMAGSAKNAKHHMSINGRSSTGGPRGHMECRGYGPCLVPGKSESAREVDMRYDEGACLTATPIEVLRRACTHMEMDERTYLSSRRNFERAVAVAAPSAATDARLARLRAEGVKLAERADAQAKTATRTLEAKAGIRLSRRYEASSGGGVPWVVDEFAGWYQAHERARYSCVKCSGDVVPEKDLIGCWPLWSQFAPDELAFRCNRTWTADPGLHEPKRFRKGDVNAPLPCWRTCWTPMEGGAHSAAAASAGVVQTGPHCTAPCSTTPRPAWEWRQAWETHLEAFVSKTAEGREWKDSVAFVKPLEKDSFIWNVY
jgi:hypothetical protein